MLLAVFAATWANFQLQVWETKKPPRKKSLKFSEQIMPLKTSYILEWSLISPIMQILSALWKNFLFFFKRPSNYLGQFPAPNLKTFLIFLQKRFSRKFFTPHIPRILGRLLSKYRMKNFLYSGMNVD